MLLSANNSWGWTWDNVATTDTPSTTPGVAVPASITVDTKGSWIKISTTNKGDGADSTLDHDVYHVDVYAWNVATTNAARPWLMDLGISADDSTYTLLASNIVGSQRGSVPTIGSIVRLPVFIPAGSYVAARAASNPGNNQLGRVAAYFYGKPSRPDAIWTGSFCESVGIANDGSVPANCDATAITPGDTGTWSSWVSLGTTTGRLRYINLCVGARSATMTALAYHFDLGWGDATTPVKVIDRHLLLTNTAETLQHTRQDFPCDIPAGSTVYVRATCSGTPDAANFSVMALGVG